MPVSSGNSLKFSRWACRLTIRSMILPRKVPWDAPKWIYLSTLTFADPEPSYAEGRERLRSFQSWLDRNGKWAVCAPEFGEENGRLHFHLVHIDRWDAKEMWEVLRKYGFGRYDVRRRPAWLVYPSSMDTGNSGPSVYAGKTGQPGESLVDQTVYKNGQYVLEAVPADRAVMQSNGIIHPAAWYLAKYVGKRRGWPEELKGCRQWSIIGEKRFPHPVCRTRDVRITSKYLTVMPESPKPFHDFVELKFPALNVSFRHAARLDAQPDGPTHMREINADQQKKLLGLLATGDIIGLGEYRFCGVETKEMEQWKDGKKTGNREPRIIVTHKVDFGTSCERREFDDLLPAGTKPESVTPAAKSGDIVAVAVDGMRAFQGGTNFKGRIIKL